MTDQEHRELRTLKRLSEAARKVARLRGELAEAERQMAQEVSRCDRAFKQAFRRLEGGESAL